MLSVPVRVLIATVAVCSAAHTIGAQVAPPAAQQISAAVLALPEKMRDGAGVLGYKSGTKLEVLRPAKNGMLCLADDPAEAKFHVSCYHESMDPFMARGRSLRAQGVTGTQVDTVRFAEVKAGKLKMPTAPASLYQIFADDYNASTGALTKARNLFVVYIPFATEATTGLSTVPSADKPWLMLPGTPKAHIMFSLGM
ncbi:MAG: hypothetical protein IT353_11030 [Gemmatimonadaceae bacterium]|nr:hypothetical protein [Gemmatimonadaceae bacterium]